MTFAYLFVLADEVLAGEEASIDEEGKNGHETINIIKLGQQLSCDIK